MCSAMPGRHQSHFCGPYTTFVATTASQIVISPCNTLCVLSIQLQHPCWPQPSPVAIITLLCVLTLPLWPQKASFVVHVATTASCWPSAYPCSYHNFLLVLSGSVKPKKAHFCGPHSLPLSLTKKQDGLQTTPVSS